MSCWIESELLNQIQTRLETIPSGISADGEDI